MTTPRSALPLVLASLTALAVAMGIGRFAFTPMLPWMQADNGLSLRSGSALAFANYLGYLLGALGTARLPLKPERILQGGLALVVLSTALMGASDRFVLWWALRFGAGVASASVLVATANLTLARLADLGRPTLASIPFAGVGAGIAVAGLLCTAAARVGESSQTGWWWLAGIALIGSLYAGAQLHPPSRPTAIPSSTPPPIAPPTGRRLLLVCYGLAGFGYSLPATFLPAQARLLAPNPAIFGWIWPLFGLAAIVSTLVCGRLHQRWPRKRLWAGAQAILAIGVVLPYCRGGLGVLAVAAVCVGATFMVITMLGMQEARAVAGPRAQPLMATMTAAFALGQLAGPLLVGVASAAGATPACIALPAGVGLIASSLALVRHPGTAA